MTNRDRSHKFLELKGREEAQAKSNEISRILANPGLCASQLAAIANFGNAVCRKEDMAARLIRIRLLQQPLQDLLNKFRRQLTRHEPQHLMPGFIGPMPKDLCLQGINSQRLLHLEAIHNRLGAEILQKGAMHKGVVAAAHEAEHEIATPQLFDQRPGGAIGSQPGDGLQALAERAFELILVDQIDQVAGFPIHAAALQRPGNSLHQPQLIFGIQLGIGQLGRGLKGQIGLPLMQQQAGALAVELRPIPR